MSSLKADEAFSPLSQVHHTHHRQQQSTEDFSIMATISSMAPSGGHSTTQTVQNEPLTIRLRGAPLGGKRTNPDIQSWLSDGPTMPDTAVTSTTEAFTAKFSSFLSDWLSKYGNKRGTSSSVANLTPATANTTQGATPNRVTDTMLRDMPTDWSEKYGQGHTLSRTITTPSSCLKGKNGLKEKRSVTFNPTDRFSLPLAETALEYWKDAHGWQAEQMADKLAEQRLPERDRQIRAYARHKEGALPTSAATLEDVLGNPKYEITYDTGTTKGTVGLDLAGIDANSNLNVWRVRDPETNVVRLTKEGLASKSEWEILSKMSIDDADEAGKLTEWSKAWHSFCQSGQKIICPTASSRDQYRKSLLRVGEKDVPSILHSMTPTEEKAGRRGNARMVWNDLDAVSKALSEPYSGFEKESGTGNDTNVDSVVTQTPGQRARGLFSKPASASDTVTNLSRAARNPLI